MNGSPAPADSLAALLDASPAGDGSPAVLVPGQPPLTYGQLRDAVSAHAESLAGQPPGTLLALEAADARELVAWTLAAGRAGAALCYVPPGQPESERARVAESAGARLHIAAADGGAVLTPLRPAGGAEHVAPGAVVFHTSGTSGLPKGVVREAGALAREARAVAERLEYSATDSVLCAVPLHHAYGFALGLTAVLAAGAAVVATRPLTPRGLEAAVTGFGVTVAVAAPAQYAAWARSADRRTPPAGLLRLCVSSGAPLDAAAAAAFRGAWGRELAQQYGSSECGAVSIDLPPGRDPGCVGSPYPGVRLEAGQEGRPGPVLVRGAHLSSGYLPAGSGSWPQASPEGPLSTGDLGWLDARGRLHLAGRRSDLVNVHGLKVDPAEVAAVLARHPAVADCAVVGVDRAGGQDQWLAAFVVLEGREAAEEELFAHCRARLSAHKVPRRFLVVDRIPRTDTGKVAARTLSARARAGG